MALVSDLVVHAQASGEGNARSRFREGGTLAQCNASVEPFVPVHVPLENLTDPNGSLSNGNVALDKKIESGC
jgi:hypothetical protein